MSTIKDVAKRAGVGVGTVSRVITGNGFVSQETAKRVRKIIEELDFRPSRAARALQAGKSNTIGVFLPVVHGSFYTPILHAIYTALRRYGRHMVVAFGDRLEDERTDALQAAQFLIDHGCDGLLMMGTSLKAEDIDDLLAIQSRLVVLNRTFPRHAGICFMPDHKAAGRLAARTLWQAGHRRVAVIEGPKLATDNIQRLRGFYDELAALGVDSKRIPRVVGDFSPRSGWVGTEALLAQKKPFTALFCANDETALGALSCLGQMGISVPQDISVMGYDGLDFSSFASPPLTTVQVPWCDLAQHALNHLCNLCYGKSLEVTREFPINILWRSSLAPIRAPKSRNRKTFPQRVSAGD